MTERIPITPFGVELIEGAYEIHQESTLPCSRCVWWYEDKLGLRVVLHGNVDMIFCRTHWQDVVEKCDEARGDHSLRGEKTQPWPEEFAELLEMPLNAV